MPIVLQPGCVVLHAQGSDQPQTGFGIREGAHHQRAAFDLLIQPVHHVRALQVIAARRR